MSLFALTKPPVCERCPPLGRDGTRCEGCPRGILAVIARLPFKVARSMPHMPHEYAVRHKTADDADYVALFEAIMRDGVVHWWRRKHARYLYPGDGWSYWSLASMHSDAEARHPLWVSTHINRARIEERPKWIAAGLLSLDEPELMDRRYIRYPAEPPADFPHHSQRFKPLPLAKRYWAPE